MVAPDAVTVLPHPGGVILSGKGAVVVIEKLFVVEIHPVLSVICMVYKTVVAEPCEGSDTLNVFAGLLPDVATPVELFVTKYCKGRATAVVVILIIGGSQN